MTGTQVLTLIPADFPGFPGGLLVARQADLLLPQVLGRILDSPGLSFQLDFSQVEHLTVGAAHCLGPVLHQQFTRARHPEQHLVYTRLTENVKHALQCVFSVQQLKPGGTPGNVAVGFLQDQGFCTLGELPLHLQEVLDLLYQHGPQTAHELQARGVRAASKKLHVLHVQHPWLLKREQETTGKVWAYRHAPIVLQGAALQVP